MLKITMVFMLIGSVLGCCLNVVVQAQTPADWEQKERDWKQKAADAYVFPIRPGMPEWASLTISARLEACQIPQEILKTISTTGLVETCLNYPFLPDMMFSDTPQKGFEGIISRFNGLQELLQRRDAGLVLLERYKTLDYEYEYTKWQHGQSSLFVFPLLYLEKLLAYDPIIANMSQQTKILLLQESLRMYWANQYSQSYKGTHNMTLLIMARLLEQMNYEPLRQRIANIATKDAETLRQEILQHFPDMKEVHFTPIPHTATERYQGFLQTGGMGGTDEIFHAIIFSTEEYLSEWKNEK